HCLRRDDVHEWSTLHTGKQFAIDLFRVLFLAQDQSTAWTTQRLMRRRGDVVSVRHWRRMKTSRDRSRDVCDVSKHPRTDTARNLADPFEVDRARISGSATHEQLRPVLFRNALQLVVIDLFGLFRNAVISNLVTDSRKVHRMAVRQ